ncbi:MAG: TatD family hydrolase [Phycisphaerales bacterium JB065]
MTLPSIIDTHCHLTFPDYRGRVDTVLADAKAAGVGGCITISTNPSDCTEALAVARSHANVWCSSGVHPLYADKVPTDATAATEAWAAITRVAASEECVAWGELGLDNHYDKPPKSVQLPVLQHQLALISELREASGERRIDKPVVIHCREAFKELIPILRDTALDPSRFVFHCFTGTPGDIEMVLDYGAWVSFTGVLTYKNADDVRAAARLFLEATGGDRVMVETDAPFLTPHPHRGVRPNEPKFVVHVAETMAEIQGELTGESRAAFFARLNGNVERFFGIRVES